ncbi:PRC-barrel domain-containing protein [Actinoplanes sp. NPDC051859]|uniref:PRC-barrel domain-containing protein n=1 Tax=Actinoplanes sp. NPDC051859 TaxID=3363909 RepID=UPI0037B977CE
MQPFVFEPWSWRDPAATSNPDTAHIADADRDDAARTDNQTGTDLAGADLLAGYHVEATDGSIGKIDEATYDVGNAYLVVDTGPWIFGRKVLLPAGTVVRVDHDDNKVHVDRTKAQIKDSPEYDKDTFNTPAYREQVGTYYTGSYRDTPPTN